MTPEIEKQLEDLVANTPRELPPGNTGCWCALSRVAYQMLGISRCGQNLVEVAESIGLTENQAKGVMHGWDEAREKGRGCFRDSIIQPGFAEGNILGRRLYAKYGAPQ